MAKSVQKNISVATVLTMSAFVITGFFFSVFCIDRISRGYQKSMADTVMAFADAVIDADDARDFLTTRSTGKSYDFVNKKLSDFQSDNKSFVRRISLVSFSNMSGTYIYDTGGEDFGDTLEYDRYMGSIKTDLISGRNSWSAMRNNVLCVFQPLRTVDDQTAGYIIIEVEEPFTKGYFLFMVIVNGIIFIVGIAFAVILIIYMWRKLFRPLRSLIEATKNFVDVAENDSKGSEIEQLEKSVRKMFIDINSGAENLSKAIYDANHDGMTQALNKRCYQSMEQMFRECSSICVIYFDVNNLKTMNDTLGHEKGDIVIKRASEYIKEFLSPSDYCFRMGGDEFLMIMTECTFRDIDRVVSRIESDAPFILNRDSDPVKCALSFGYAYAKGSYSYEELLTEAEEKMYAKKTELKQLLNMPER
ncbi:MAG: diguanylate cyclase [Ruminococcus sp.]|nr:diguanylate cyclase [Ruminococcus sp.]